MCDPLLILRCLDILSNCKEYCFQGLSILFFLRIFLSLYILRLLKDFLYKIDDIYILYIGFNLYMSVHTSIKTVSTNVKTTLIDV